MPKVWRPTPALAPTMPQGQRRQRFFSYAGPPAGCGSAPGPARSPGACGVTMARWPAAPSRAKLLISCFSSPVSIMRSDVCAGAVLVSVQGRCSSAPCWLRGCTRNTSPLLTSMMSTCVRPSTMRRTWDAILSLLAWPECRITKVLPTRMTSSTSFTPLERMPITVPSPTPRMRHLPVAVRSNTTMPFDILPSTVKLACRSSGRSAGRYTLYSSP